MSPDESARTRNLSSGNHPKITGLQWKIMLISGVGFFTDAYDLFIIGVVLAMLKPEWHPSPVETGLITSTALLASAVGAMVFGRIADLLGRKKIYGLEVLVLAAGAIASAVSPNMFWLILFRIVLGLGIGGDYPLSATIMSEYAEKRTRGMLISLVFSMQAAGLIFGPLFASALLAAHVHRTSPGASFSPSEQSPRWLSSGHAATSMKRLNSKPHWRSANRPSPAASALKETSGPAISASCGSAACWSVLSAQAARGS